MYILISIKIKAFYQNISKNYSAKNHLILLKIYINLCQNLEINSESLNNLCHSSHVITRFFISNTFVSKARVKLAKNQGNSE